MNMEKVVQQTDFDAYSCKLAAISKGYLPSPSLQVEECNYLHYGDIHMAYLKTLKTLIGRRSQGQINRALQSSFPVMNYGTYLRTVSIDRVLNEYIKKNQFGNVQVVNLGCGSDLRMIPLLNNYENLVYVDVDYQDSIKLKSDTLWNNKELQELLKLNEPNEAFTYSERYKLVSCDLKNVQQVIKCLKSVTSTDVPTIFITECALCYLSDKESQQLINMILQTYINKGYWISYDPIGGSENVNNDRFGKIMLSNLKESRQLEMPTLMKYYSKDLYLSRWLENKNISVNTKIEDMWEVFNGQVPQYEKNRLKGLQFLDEVEELKVMQTHYVLLRAQWQIKYT